jgi:hypothetical protein
MYFGIFDHLDHNEPPLAGFCEQRLNLTEIRDKTAEVMPSCRAAAEGYERVTS